MADILHFSHGNGFPARTYRKLLDNLALDFSVQTVERYGHDSRYPVTPGWPHLVTQLLDAIAPHGRPVWLVGHSLGGMLSLMAALRMPQFVCGVVMLDSPVVAGWRAQLLRLSQLTGLDERYSPAAVTKKRRTHWQDDAEAFAHFRAKRSFARWDEEVLRDYIAYGTEPSGNDRQEEHGVPQGRTLAFRRETEYRIYRTLPHDLGRRLKRGVQVPVACIAGTHSLEMRQAGLGATRRLVGERLLSIEGGHLYPMEKPLETAALIRELITDMRAHG